MLEEPQRASMFNGPQRPTGLKEPSLPFLKLFISCKFLNG